MRAMAAQQAISHEPKGRPTPDADLQSVNDGLAGVAVHGRVLHNHA